MVIMTTLNAESGSYKPKHPYANIITMPHEAFLRAAKALLEQ